MKGREVNKLFCSLLVGATLASCPRQEETRDKRVPVVLGLVHWHASWPLSTPSGQDVSLGEEESHQSHHLLQEEGSLPGPETGLLCNTRK